MLNVVKLWSHEKLLQTFCCLYSWHFLSILCWGNCLRVTYLNSVGDGGVTLHMWVSQLNCPREWVWAVTSLGLLCHSPILTQACCSGQVLPAAHTGPSATSGDLYEYMQLFRNNFDDLSISCVHDIISNVKGSECHWCRHYSRDIPRHHLRTNV